MLLKNILFEIETPEQFDPPRVSTNILNRILNEPDPRKQIMLANNNLQLLGTGSGRFVYDIGEGKAVKLAPLEPEQNKREAEHWGCVKHTAARKVFVEVIEAAPDYKWLIAEKVVGFRTDKEPLQLIVNSILETLNNPEEITAAEIEDYFCYSLEGFWSHISSDEIPPFDSSWYNDLKSVIQSCGIIVEEFLADNLGYRPSTGELVILDFGY